jgi:hypothetical protein
MVRSLASSRRHTSPIRCAVETTPGDGASGRRIVLLRKGDARASAVAELDELPLDDASARELFADGILESFAPDDVETSILPHWRQVLQPGGTLRVRCLDWHAVLEPYRTGTVGAQELHQTIFGCSAERRMVYTPELLLQLLARTGFVDCSITRRGREVEVVARRPVTP